MRTGRWHMHSAVCIRAVSATLLVLGICNGCGHAARYDVWAGFDEYEAELSGYAVYTYVLFGRNLDTLPDAEELRERYSTLLREIVASTSRDQEGRLRPPSETNLFAIPLKERYGAAAAENYGYTLSLKYLQDLAAVLEEDPDLGGRLRTREGPFLVSTPVPLREVESVEHCLLFADLTGKNVAGTAEIVAAYRNTLLEGNPAAGPGMPAEPIECERLNSFRLALLDMILEADDYLSLVVKVDMTNWFRGPSDAVRRLDGLTTQECEELQKLRRENRRLREESPRQQRLCHRAAASYHADLSEAT